MTRVDRGVGQNRGGAVGSQAVVKPRMLTQFVDRSQVIEKHPADVGRGRLQPIQIDLFGRIGAEVGAQPDQIPLVGDDINQLVLPEEAGQGGVGLALVLARLDGNGEVIVAKAEAQEQMGNRRPHPVRRHQIDPVQSIEVEGFVVVGRGEIGFAAVIEVADVVNRDPVAVEAGVRQHGEFRLPVAIVARLGLQPEQQHRQQSEHQADQAPAAGPLKKQADEGRQTQHGKAAGQREPQGVGPRRQIVEGQCSPGRQAGDDQPGHQPADQMERANPHGVPGWPACSNRMRRTSSITSGWAWQE